MALLTQQHEGLEFDSQAFLSGVCRFSGSLPQFRDARAQGQISALHCREAELVSLRSAGQLVRGEPPQPRGEGPGGAGRTGMDGWMDCCLAVHSSCGFSASDAFHHVLMQASVTCNTVQRLVEMKHKVRATTNGIFIFSDRILRQRDRPGLWSFFPALPPKELY